MAAPKTTPVSPPTFSTIVSGCGIEQFIAQLDSVLDRAKQDAQFKRTHGMNRKEWDATLSPHLHGDLQ